MGPAVTSKTPTVRASKRLLTATVLIALLAVMAGVFVVVNRIHNDTTIGSMIGLSEDGASASFWATYEPSLPQTGKVITLGQSQPALAYESQVSVATHPTTSTILLHAINGYESCHTVGQQWKCGAWSSTVGAEVGQEMYLPPGITRSLKRWSSPRLYSLAFSTRTVFGQFSRCVSATTVQYPERISERCLNTTGVLTYTADWTRALAHGPRVLVHSNSLASYSTDPVIAEFAAPAT